jgi:hypothetical protein
MSRACRRRVRAAYSIERLAGELAVRYRDLICGLQAAGAGAASVPAAPPRPAGRAQVPAGLAGRKE